MNLDYTIKKYMELCRAIAENYKCLTFSEYLSNSNFKNNFIVLRHDVDRMPANALKAAVVEHELNINSTYYFRTNKSVFKPEIIEKIASLGHEIGYHYECLDKANGNFEEAIRIFEEDLKKFRKICDVKTICMHGNPLTKYDNRDLWKKYDFKDFGILGETYLSLGGDIAYFSDTGRNWGKEYKIKDYNVNLNNKINYSEVNIRTTDDLINLIKNQKFNKLCILTHPERWSKNLMEWIAYFIFDKGVQGFKILRNKI